MQGTLLITGGAGYIGAQTAWLARDARIPVLIVDDLSTGVRANVPPDATFVQADVSDPALMARLMREHDVTALIHFAAKLVLPESVAKPALYYRNNVGGLCAVLEACEAAGVKRWIFSSTAAIYGEAPEPARETQAPAPQSPYGRSKLMAEQALADAAARDWQSGHRPALLQRRRRRSRGSHRAVHGQRHPSVPGRLPGRHRQARGARYRRRRLAHP